MLVQNHQVNAAAGAIVPLRLLTVASADRRMESYRRNPGAHEDANAESVYLLICARTGVGHSANARPSHMNLLLGAAGPSRWELRRWDRGAGCGCWAACPVALALLFAVTVFAL